MSRYEEQMSGMFTKLESSEGEGKKADVLLETLTLIQLMTGHQSLDSEKGI